MSDEETAYGERRDKPTPRVEAGEQGLAYDGTPIPADEMVPDVTVGAAPDALARFREGAHDSATLLAMLRGAAAQRAAHRPAIMLRGDIQPKHLLRLERLLEKLEALAKKKVKFSALASSLLGLLAPLIRQGAVYTDDRRTIILVAYGFDQHTIDTFDTALGIIWSMATDSPYLIVEGMEQVVRDVIEEVGLDEEDLS